MSRSIRRATCFSPTRGEQIYLGSVFCRARTSHGTSDFHYKGSTSACCSRDASAASATRPRRQRMDLYGVSEVSARPRAMRAACWSTAADGRCQKWYQAIGSQSGLRSTTPDRPRTSACRSCRWVHAAAQMVNQMGLTVSFVGRNLWMIYCKAPFDPEAVASAGAWLSGHRLLHDAVAAQSGFQREI